MKNLLIPQPFANIRGALVEGSDSIRHEVNLINHDGDICVGGIIDMVFDGNTNYKHLGGTVNFEGRSTCMMFRNGAVLEVGDDVSFRYGQEGKGILALRPGSTIRLGKGSSLLIDNLLWLQGIPTAKFPDPQIYMELNPGSTLAFGEHAHIINDMSEGGDTRLNIYMNGGVLDDSQLSPASRLLIRKIYPDPGPDVASRITIHPNPVGELLTIKYQSGKYETIELRVFDLKGARLLSQAFAVAPGENKLETGLPDWPSGIYVAQIRTPSGTGSSKFVK